MVECALPRKDAEQYPLLMVTGSGDGATRAPTTTVVSSVWGVTSRAPKNSWRDRMPEFLSICWMTFILLGISFLVFYVIGFLAYSQQPFIFIKCNNSKPASNVYYHQVIPNGDHISFMTYSEYLSHMAMQYPLLRFNVIFLMDDKFQSAFPLHRHPGFYGKLMPMPYYTPKLYNDVTNREMRLFQERYPNVNITIIHLSKFMAMTPLKYKWRTIPSFQLPFYARIFSVWKNGGIAIDLQTFINQYNNNQRLDRRMSAILKQHNDGIKSEGYADILNKIDREDENKFLTLFYGLVNEILNDTRSFFNNTLPFFQVSTEGSITVNNTLSRTLRFKRDIPKVEAINISDIKLNDATSTINSIPANTTAVNLTEIDTNAATDQTNVSSDDIQVNVTLAVLPANVNDTKRVESEKYPISENMNKTDTAQVVMIYDVSLVAGGNWVADFFPGPIAPSAEFKERTVSKNPGFKKPMNNKGYQPILSIESDGMFVAASSQLHPFLGYLLCSDGRRILPKFTIQDALYTQCSGLFKNDMYCNNIYVLEI